MIDKIHTIQKLKDTGLKMFNAYVSSDTKVGEKFLRPRVISMWDFKDYSDFFIYYDVANNHNIRLVVNLCVKTDEKNTKIEHLKKDLSNIKEFNINLTNN